MSAAGSILSEAVERPPYSVPRAPAFGRMFRRDRLTLGVFFPIESYAGDVPRMKDQVELARRAETAGFAALWTRDVPLRDPTFGDVGQIYDPWVWIGYILGHTSSIALATGSIILPLRHPLHVAKAAASIDNLSGGRLFLGLASGDRPTEFPAFGVELETRGERFREAFVFLEAALGEDFPVIRSNLGEMRLVDLLPKPLHGRIPIGITGSSRQTVGWIAEHADAWIMYPRSLSLQQQVILEWRDAVAVDGRADFKPFAQSLYIDLTDDPYEAPVPIHLGFRSGRFGLLEHLARLEALGVNHVILNLKYGARPAPEVLDELASEVVPSFPAHTAGADDAC